MTTTTCEYCDVPRLDSEDAHDPIDCIDTLRTTLARLTAEVATYQRALQLALCLCDPPSVDACKEWIADREARNEEFGQ